MKKLICRSFRGVALGAVLALAAGAAQAEPTPVAGVIVGGPEETTFKFSNLTESFVTGVGDTLFGFGRVTQINSLFGEDFCVNGNCELTYTFTGYQVTEFVAPTPGSPPTPNDSRAVFTGGEVNFYLDDSVDSDLATTTGFTDGTLWLSAIGFETLAEVGPNAGATGTLFSVGSSFADAEQIIGNGNGLLEITGGAAGSYFGIGNLSTFSSEFQTSIPGWTLPVSGTASLQIIATEVPEPAPLALLGIGLLGLGIVSRARRQI
jgi:PEP-CTERM motif